MDEIKEPLPATKPESSTQVDTQKFSWQTIKRIFGLNNRFSLLLFAAALVSVVVATAFAYFFLPPSDFTPRSTFLVKDGSSLGEVSVGLVGEHLIRSRTVFEFCAITMGGEKRIMAGEYLFKELANACSIARRIVNGVFGIPVARVTIPEGLSNKEAAAVLAKSLSHFDAATFINEAADQEGYLFPDTYFFPENTSEADVIARMKVNFEKKIKLFMPEVEASKHSLRDVLIMASILEKEVATDEDRAIVSGILWKRLDQSIPLQVDAPFMYILGKKSSELTQTDLKMYSAYNTYKNHGLPKGPINNPGTSAIRAALFPKATPYFYYLADKDGVTHYAKTFDEHKANKQKYLR